MKARPMPQVFRAGEPKTARRWEFDRWMEFAEQGARAIVAEHFPSWGPEDFNEEHLLCVLGLILRRGVKPPRLPERVRLALTVLVQVLYLRRAVAGGAAPEVVAARALELGMGVERLNIARGRGAVAKDTAHKKEEAHAPTVARWLALAKKLEAEGIKEKTTQAVRISAEDREAVSPGQVRRAFYPRKRPQKRLKV